MPFSGLPPGGVDVTATATVTDYGSNTATQPLTFHVGPTSDVTRSFHENDTAATIKFYQTFNDVIVAGFICGTSRIATMPNSSSVRPTTSPSG